MVAPAGAQLSRTSRGGFDRPLADADDPAESVRLRAAVSSRTWSRPRHVAASAGGAVGKTAGGSRLAGRLPRSRARRDRPRPGSRRARSEASVGAAEQRRSPATGRFSPCWRLLHREGRERSALGGGRTSVAVRQREGHRVAGRPARGWLRPAALRSTSSGRARARFDLAEADGGDDRCRDRPERRETGDLALIATGAEVGEHRGKPAAERRRRRPRCPAAGRARRRPLRDGNDEDIDLRRWSRTRSKR